VQTTVFPTSTLLPTSGFADDVGLPGLLGVGILLVVVIFLARGCAWRISSAQSGHSQEAVGLTPAGFRSPDPDSE
jgi:hypothetical protein